MSLWGFGNVYNVGWQLFKKSTMGKQNNASVRMSTYLYCQYFFSVLSQWFTIDFFCLLFFFTLGGNERGYGLGRFAGGFPVAIATKEMRAQRLPEAH